MVDNILNLTFALIVLRECAGMMMDCQVSMRLDMSLITISALPSMTWMKVSKGEIFSLNASPESNETALTLPVVFLMIVLITTEFGIYSMISTMMKAFDFSNSAFCNANRIKVKPVKQDEWEPEYFFFF